jgi:hypothetical protein
LWELHSKILVGDKNLDKRKGVRNTIFRKALPSVVSGYGKRLINLNKVVATFEKHIFLSQTDLTRTGLAKVTGPNQFSLAVGHRTIAAIM